MATDIEENKTAPLCEALEGFITRGELATALDRHRMWIETQGESGERADLSDAKLARAEFTGVNLRNALLQKANLRGADLSLADLQGACLVQADLRDANLLGTELLDADLRGATLTGAEGLWIGRLGGANLFGAVLPESLSFADGPKVVARATRVAYWLLMVMLLANLVLWGVIATTTDVRLLKNSSALAFLHSGNAVPIVGFYLVMPLLLLAFYFTFHFFLLRLWGGLATLPSVFPDGRTPDESGPWLVMGLVRSQVRWGSESRSPLSYVETALASLLAYWIVPLTLVLFWARYLPRQNLRDTMLHVLLVSVAVTAAAILPRVAGRRPRAGGFDLRAAATKSNFSMCCKVALGTWLILTLLSLGIIWGAPRDVSRAPELKPLDIRRWAAATLWTIGYNPYATLIDGDISSRPAQWSGQSEDLPQVQGARLDQANLRYAQGYRAFLVNAHLWKADLRSAFLSESDLRGANLRQANLSGATLDRARLNHAVLARAELRGANLTRIDLQAADLSFASLQDAIIADASLGTASLYTANLLRAQLMRSNLEKADLRDANLENANLTFANMNAADLWSAKLAGAQLKGTQLGTAMLIDADLRTADLRGANLEGAILRGANLAGADLRNALGLTAAQVCSTMSRNGTQLDRELQGEVEMTCGPAR